MKNLLFRSLRVAQVLFCFWCGCLESTVLAADVKSYIIEKGIQYIQDAPGTPVTDANNGAIFVADVNGSGTNRIRGVFLTIANGFGDDLPEDAADEFKLKVKYSKQSSLDRNFPDGLYSLSINTVHDGNRTVSLSLIGDLYPSIPHLNNYAALQQFDAGSYFMFSWDPMSGGASNDFAQLHIEDDQGNKVFETPDNGEEGALDGQAMAALMPPHTLMPGQRYQAFLYFAKAVSHDTSMYPEAFGFSGYYKRTKISFQTAPTAIQSDLKLYGLIKTRRFQQATVAAPVPATTKPFSFEAFADAAATSIVSLASFRPPSGASQALAIQSDNKTFEFTRDYTNKSALDADFAKGTYMIQAATSAGAKTIALVVGGDGYPEPPHLSGILTSVNATQELSISWDPFAGGAGIDFIQLHIDDDLGNKAFETPDYGKSGAANGTATVATIPANTLLPGRSYAGRLVFQKNTVFETAAYPGALGLVSFVSWTNFRLTTASGGGSLPLLLEGASFSKLGGFAMVISGTANERFRVEGSIDLRQWAALSTNVLSATGTATFAELPTLGVQQHFFFRVIDNP